MSIAYYVVPFLVGIATIFQSGINKNMMAKYSLAFVILINGVVLSLFAIAGLLVYQTQTRTNNLALLKQDWQWHYLLPGFFGFCVVMGIPLAMGKIGATKTFVLLVVAQTLGAVLWDLYVDNIKLDRVQIAGAVVALVGVALINFKR